MQKIISKLSEIWSGMFIPDPDLDFLPIPDPGHTKELDPVSESATLPKYVKVYISWATKVMFPHTVGYGIILTEIWEMKCFGDNTYHENYKWT